MIGTGTCCCQERPCCSDWLFRAKPTGGVRSIDLTLEALHGWYVYDEVMSDYTLPFRTQESLSSPQTIALAYEYPIPDAFLADLADPPTAEEIARGWYVSESVTLLSIPGDPFYSGTSEPVTGRWFYGPGCFVGFWLDSDFTLPALEEDRPWWFRGYVGYMGIDEYGTDPNLASPTGIDPNAPRERIDTTSGDIRGWYLFGFDYVTCRPLLMTARDFWHRFQRTGPDSPIIYGPSGSGGPYWGVPVPGRPSEDSGNPLLLDLGGYSAPGSSPEHMIPPPEMDVYNGTNSVLEYFCVQFTATETE